VRERIESIKTWRVFENMVFFSSKVILWYLNIPCLAKVKYV
jgi:hypothetical protein